eukprot:SAG31_NODE_3115_length_4659_cov_2.837939_7_plen_172_part_00
MVPLICSRSCNFASTRAWSDPRRAEPGGGCGCNVWRCAADRHPLSECARAMRRRTACEFSRGRSAAPQKGDLSASSSHLIRRCPIADQVVARRAQVVARRRGRSGGGGERLRAGGRARFASVRVRPAPSTGGRGRAAAGDANLEPRCGRGLVFGSSESKHRPAFGGSRAHL